MKVIESIKRAGRKVYAFLRPIWDNHVPAWAKPFLRVFAGLVLLIAGFIQLFTPGQGLACMLFGIYLLSKDIPFAKRIHDRLVAYGKKLMVHWRAWRQKRLAKQTDSDR